MKKTLLTTSLTAGIIALSGVAFAQSSPGTTSPSSPSSPSMDRPSTSSPSGSSIDRSSPSATESAKPDTPPASIVGKDVTNAAGDKIGEVKSVSGKQVIVGVGGFLGMGERQVALDWAQLTMTGTGEDAKLKTSMTKDQLKELPEHKADTGSTRGGAGSGGATSPGASPRTGGGSAR